MLRLITIHFVLLNSWLKYKVLGKKELYKHNTVLHMKYSYNEIMNLFTGYSNKATCLNNLDFCVDNFRIFILEYTFSWLNMPFQGFPNTA